MQIEYEISEQDFIDGQRLAIKNSPMLLVRWTRVVLPVFGLALLVFLMQSVAQQGFSWRAIAGLAFCLFFIGLPFLNRLAQKNLYAKSTIMHGKLSLQAAEDGVHFQGPAFSSQIAWSHFADFFEDDRSFVLYTNQRVFNMVPKHGLTSEQINTFREYLERNIKRASAASHV